ncbi:MAG: excinuclease ABC subunit UvrC [Alphaproteobacteria bacterium]|nr:excinuclease ABC subunit UvrC [Alphaproteobacteria bacterium]
MPSLHVSRDERRVDATRRASDIKHVVEPESAVVRAAGAALAPPARLGATVIREQLNKLPGKPGVYRMLDARGQVLYVGKAKNLRKRVASYARSPLPSARTARMVAQTAAIEVITTHTEVEAMLLESNLIKKLKPRFNIGLRDDKSLPYILIARDHAWPHLVKHRGARARRGEYFGPFASAGAVNATLNALQRAFPLRTCTDAVFAARTRPCLQYQIRRCTAPCVGRINQTAYDAIVDEARRFLTGKTHEVQQQLSGHMSSASAARDYETAAVYRDRIRALTQIQAHQDINVRHLEEADVIAAYQRAGQTCVQVFFFRSGQNYGNRAYYPAHTDQAEAGEVLTAFLGQFYAAIRPPRLVLVSHEPAERGLIEEALSVRAERRVRLRNPRRGAKYGLIARAIVNAREALERRLAEAASQNQLLEGTRAAFGLANAPQRIEVYDNSHISGRHPVGCMIVAGPEGFMKRHYRRFTIRGAAAPGDDYAMMREVLTRRFSRLRREDPERDKGTWPDLVLLDGGSGQLSVAREVLQALGIADVPLVGIAKGPDRDAGREHFHIAGRSVFQLPERDPVLYFLQRLRDEAHRFAIGGHRAKRARVAVTSTLDEVAGVGSKRKRALLHHFGSASAVSAAGLADLEAVPGINRRVAQRIYEHFHAEA